MRPEGPSAEPNVREAQAGLKTCSTAEKLLHPEVDIERTIADLLKRDSEISLVCLGRTRAAAAAIEIPDDAWTQVCNEPRTLTSLCYGERNTAIAGARCNSFSSPGRPM